MFLYDYIYFIYNCIRFYLLFLFMTLYDCIILYMILSFL